MPLLQATQKAPAFKVANQQDKPVALTDFAGKKNVVIYFYPKDDTPGCTIEANQFTALARQFAEFDTVILGVSKDSCDSHRQFIDKYKLQVDLLADTKGEMCEAYGVWQEKTKEGVKRMGIVRSTFIINKQGVLVDVEYGVNPEGHAQKVLDKISRL
ncbi:MAG TPA: peroxiredoxin, partial [Gammaproteobacteria bacterium]|nr:peroxiredoxin [Gammaproteobacteria bacterium]